MPERLKVGGFLAAWLVLTGTQVAAFQALADHVPVLVAAVLALQLLKTFPTRARLRDLGRSEDDAIYGVVPFLNAALFSWLLAATPKETIRAQRLAAQQGSSALTAWAEGMRRATRSGPSVALATLAAGVVGGSATEAMQAPLTSLATTPGAYDLLALLAAALGLATLIASMRSSPQDRRAGRASVRQGWLPALTFAPAVAALMLVVLTEQRSQQAMMVQMAFPPMIASFLLAGPIAAVTTVLQLRAAAPTLKDRATLTAPVLLPLAALLGMRSQANQLGFQLAVIAGVWTTVSWAFAEFVAVFDPDAPARATSQTLVRRIRPRIFKVHVIWLMATVALELGVWSLFVDPTVAFSALLGAADAVPPWLHVVGAVLSTLVSWPCTLALLVLYEEQTAAEPKAR